jgi:broad specificity phosphatase PhoE
MLVLRHAQSEWNDLGRWQGRADPPLSELGSRQAALAASRLGAVDAIVASPLERARVTAEILAEANGVGPVIFDDDLVERDVAEWSGLTRDEIESGWPGYLETARRPPGWEEDDIVLERALAALARLESTYRGAIVVVVTHGGVIGTIERRHGQASGRLANLAGRSLTHSGSSLVLGERLALLDDDELTVPAQL